MRRWEPGEQHPEIIWLTSCLNDPGCGLGELCALLKDADLLRRKLRSSAKRRRTADFPNWEAREIPSRSEAEYGRFTRLQTEINDKLARWKSARRLTLTLESSKWIVNLSLADRALSELLEHAQEGRLDRIRHCDGCRFWYVARVKLQRCCSSKCRQRVFSQLPDAKRARAEYMRKWRTLHKSRYFKSTHSETRTQRRIGPR